MGQHHHEHGHAHSMTATGRHRKRLILVAAMTASVFVAQLIGGILSGSLALIADAGHMLIDSAGLIIALIASFLATSKPSARRTYGLQRAEILAAMTNAILLCGIAVGVLFSAIHRWGEPVEISSGLMLTIAAVGAAVNLAGLIILSPGKDESLNLKGAYLEVLGDLLGSIAVIIAAVVIHFTGFTKADSIAAVVIFCLILPRAWSLLREVTDVLLEAAPAGIDPREVRNHLSEVSGVESVHDLHVWAITSGSPVLTAHVVVDDGVFKTGQAGTILDELSDRLLRHFDLGHVTIQLEPSTHLGHEVATHA